jgi:N-hydroxyarylamine O-acetyltransferase
VRLTNERLQAYLRRIGFDSPVSVDLATLAALQRAHLLAVPFENLNVHLGRRIELDIDAIVSKVVDEHRGGFCYELNSAFAALLVSCGFDVTLIEGRVYSGDIDPQKLGIRFDHLALIVSVGADRYLADVGFGALSDEPLDFDSRAEQHDAMGVFQIRERDDGWLDVCRGDARFYRMSPEPRVLSDFAAGCDYNQTSPDSAFTKNTICTLRTARGRVTLAGLTLIETVDGDKQTREIAAGELGSVLEERFGVVLGGADLAKLSMP